MADDTAKHRAAILAVLATMPEEAFGWFVLAAQPAAMVHGGNAQIWPDGLGGFMPASRAAIDRLRAEAAKYLASKP